MGGQLLLPKSGLRTEMTNGILYLSLCTKSSLFVAFMIKISAGFYRVQILRKAYEHVTFFSVGAVLASL